MLRTPVVDLQCQNDECGMIFQSEYLNQKYCSFRCKSRASERRRRMKDKLRRPRIVAAAESVDAFHDQLRETARKTLTAPMDPAKEAEIRARKAILERADRGEISEEEAQAQLRAMDGQIGEADAVLEQLGYTSKPGGPVPGDGGPDRRD
jgi:hypothetical protein